MVGNNTKFLIWVAIGSISTIKNIASLLPAEKLYFISKNMSSYDMTGRKNLVSKEKSETSDGKPAEE